jgi:D-alanyl-D-alanine dipeptidase
MEALPKGYKLGIIEGWRPGYIQKRMWLTSWLRFKKLHPDWSDHQIKRIVNRFVAPPEAAVPPPHSTGGAVDLQLYDAYGKLVDLSSPYEVFDPHSYPVDTKGLSDEAAKNRAILREAMLASGMTNYPSEWWHWSYGDQGWAYRGGHSHAIYGQIKSPEGWKPNPIDVNDEPLVRVSTSDPKSGFPKLK